MTIHVSFTKTVNKKGHMTDMSFMCNHTGEMLGFGCYTNGWFEMIEPSTGSIRRFRSAALAWRTLNNTMVDKYGY